VLFNYVVSFCEHKKVWFIQEKYFDGKRPIFGSIEPKKCMAATPAFQVSYIFLPIRQYDSYSFEHITISALPEQSGQEITFGCAGKTCHCPFIQLYECLGKEAKSNLLSQDGIHNRWSFRLWTHVRIPFFGGAGIGSHGGALK